MYVTMEFALIKIEELPVFASKTASRHIVAFEHPARRGAGSGDLFVAYPSSQLPYHSR
jgi:hypothetical protein